VSKLRRKGAVGVFSRLGSTYWQLKTRAYYRPQFARLGKRSVIRKPMFIANPGGISIGEGCFVRDGARLEVVDRIDHAQGRLIIGNNVHFEQNVHIAACGTVTIEDDVCIAAGVAILDTSHPHGYPGEGNRVTQIQSGDAYVHIGKRVFIGVGSVVLPNVTIGDNSVVGAGSVVTQDIPANCIAAGTPARVIRSLPTGPSERANV
jgi:acetyltransferase-like isoleucine patch superfamily enzyme